MTKKERVNNFIKHALTLLLIAGSAAVAVLYFGERIFFRTMQGGEDLLRSVCYYFIFLVTGREDVIAPTVQLLPAEMETLLPLSYEEFAALARLFVELFFNKDVFLMWGEQTLQIISDVANYVSLFALPLAVWIFVMWLCYRSVDNRYNEDTVYLKGWKWFRNKTLRPCWRWVKDFASFLKSKRIYFWALLGIWCYALNLLTIALEAVAFVFYVGPAGGLENIFVQIAKFVIDFSVAWFFIPGPVWFAFGYWLFHLWRRHLGVKNLKAKIKLGVEFIKKYVGALFFVGRQRSKKTSCIVMCKLLYERFYRERACKKLKRWKKRFPAFPWINVVKFTQAARADRRLFMVYHCRKFARRLRAIYRLPNGRLKHKWEAWFRRRYGYTYKNLMFDYDPSEDGFEYDNGLELIDVFKAIEVYMQLFWVYGSEGTLDFSNFSIREDFTFKDYGNFPIFDGDLLKKTTKESMDASQYSKIIDYDAFRPGVKFDEDDPFKDSAEYGIRVVEEYAKERGNKDTRIKAPKGEEGTYATQHNDGYELDNKVRGQVALIDFDDYSVGLYDDQREGSLGADNKDLATVCKIEGVAEEVFLLPFFEVEEGLFRAFEWIYDKVYMSLFSKKGSNTLLQYFLDKLFCPLFAWHERLENEFTASKVKLRVKDGAEENAEMVTIEELWLLHRVVYRGRYASDSCKSFYEYRFKRSTKGMDDYETYDDINVTMEQRRKQNSYFSELMLTKNGIETGRKPRGGM